MSQRKRKRNQPANTTTCETSTPPTISVPATVPGSEIPFSSLFRETVHALINIHLSNVLSNIIIDELLEDQWDKWKPIDGVSCDLFLPYDRSSAAFHLHNLSHIDIPLTSTVNVSHLRYHLLPYYYPLPAPPNTLTREYRKWGNGENDVDFSSQLVNWIGNIIWKDMDEIRHEQENQHDDDDDEDQDRSTTTTTTRRKKSICATKPYQRQKQRQEKERKQEKYVMQRDRVMDEMSDVERSIVYRLFASSPYSWYHFRESLPTTATLAHILSRSWSAWRSNSCSIELISPHEWIEITCMNDAAEAGQHGFRIEYQQHSIDPHPAPHPIVEGMINPMQHLQLCIRLM